MQRNYLKEKLVISCDGWLEYLTLTFSPIAKLTIIKLRNVIQESNEKDLIINVVNFCKDYKQPGMFISAEAIRIIVSVLKVICSEKELQGFLDFDVTQTNLVGKTPIQVLDMLLPLIEQVHLKFLEKIEARNKEMLAAKLGCYMFLLGTFQHESNKSLIKKLPLDIIRIITSYLHPLSLNADKGAKFSTSVHSYFNSNLLTKLKDKKQIKEPYPEIYDCRLM